MAVSTGPRGPFSGRAALHVSRMMRRNLFLRTAFPVFLGTAKPARTVAPGPASSTGTLRASTRIQPTPNDMVPADRRSNSGRMSRRRFRRAERGNRLRTLLAGLRVADRQVLAALRTATSQHAASVLGRHAGAESVLVGALATTGLIRSLHGSSILEINIDR